MRIILSLLMVLSLSSYAAAAKKVVKPMLSDLEFSLVIDNVSGVVGDFGNNKSGGRAFLGVAGSGYGKLYVYNASEKDLDGFGWGSDIKNIKVSIKFNNQQEVQNFYKMLVSCQRAAQDNIMWKSNKVIFNGTQTWLNTNLRNLNRVKNPAIEVELTAANKMSCYSDYYQIERAE